MANPKKSKDAKRRAKEARRRAKEAAEIAKKGQGRDALDWQEIHSPTVEIAVDDPDATRKTRRNMTRCRQSEAWRHNRLTSMQRDAEKEMEFAWRQRTTGLGAASSKYGPSGGGGRADLGADVDASWRRWVQAARRRRIMVEAVIDCLAEPKTLVQIERDRRMRRGQAMEQYTRGLDLWCELRGWIRGPRMDGPAHLAAEGVAATTP